MALLAHGGQIIPRRAHRDLSSWHRLSTPGSDNNFGIGLNDLFRRNEALKCGAFYSQFS
jgi:hypothetical protein